MFLFWFISRRELKIYPTGIKIILTWFLLILFPYIGTDYCIWKGLLFIYNNWPESHYTENDRNLQIIRLCSDDLKMHISVVWNPD